MGSFKFFEITESAPSMCSHTKSDRGTGTRHFRLPSTPCSLAPLAFLFLQHSSGSLCRPPEVLLCPCLCHPTCLSGAPGRIRIATRETGREKEPIELSSAKELQALNSGLSHCKSSLAVLVLYYRRHRSLRATHPTFLSSSKPNFTKIHRDQRVIVTQKFTQGSEKAKVKIQKSEYKH